MYDQNIDGTNFTKQQTTYSKPDSYPKVQKINILEPKNYANKFEKQILKIHVKIHIYGGQPDIMVPFDGIDTLPKPHSGVPV